MKHLFTVKEAGNGLEGLASRIYPHVVDMAAEPKVEVIQDRGDIGNQGIKDHK